jgi:hypothetical protein
MRETLVVSRQRVGLNLKHPITWNNRVENIIILP